MSTNRTALDFKRCYTNQNGHNSTKFQHIRVNSPPQDGQFLGQQQIRVSLFLSHTLVTPTHTSQDRRWRHKQTCRFNYINTGILFSSISFLFLSVFFIPSSFHPSSLFYIPTSFILGTRWHSWLRHCATSRKVAGSIPHGVNGSFH